MTWYRVVCDREHPPAPVADIEVHEDDTVTVTPHHVARVPELVDNTPLDDRVRAATNAILTGTPTPKYDDGLVFTSRRDIEQVQGFWFTCLMCKKLRGKKLHARVKSAKTLLWLLNRMSPELETISVECRSYLSREEWEADPSQPRYRVEHIMMRLLPLHRLCEELRNNPRGATAE